MLKFLSYLPIFLLIGSFNTASGQTLSVSGRAVDSIGEPVPHAFVYAISAEQMAMNDCKDASRVVAIADRHGRWAFNLNLNRERSISAIVLEPPANSFENKFVPLARDCDSISLELKKYAADLREEKSSGEYDLGDVAVQRLLTELMLSTESGDSWNLLRNQGLWLRIRDSKGDVIKESGLPGIAFLNQDRVVSVSLPDGLWTLEFSSGKSPRTCVAETSVKIEDSASKQLPTKVAPCIPFDSSVATMASTEAQSQLKELGFEVTRKGFFERVERGNGRAVSLYLAAGIDPNLPDKVGRTALMFALEFPEIVELLLGSGADPNRESVYGITALYIAVTMEDTELVRMLVNSGADPLTKVDTEHSKGQGQNALAVAIIRNLHGIIEILRKAKTEQ